MLTPDTYAKKVAWQVDGKRINSVVTNKWRLHSWITMCKICHCTLPQTIHKIQFLVD